MVAPTSHAVCQYAKLAAVINKVGRVVLNKPIVCAVFVFANKM
jgi:hypothetical protein